MYQIYFTYRSYFMYRIYFTYRSYLCTASILRTGAILCTGSILRTEAILCTGSILNTGSFFDFISIYNLSFWKPIYLLAFTHNLKYNNSIFVDCSIYIFQPSWVQNPRTILSSARKIYRTFGFIFFS